MKITVKTLKGETHTFDVEPTLTIMELKVLIQGKLNVEPDAQKLIFKGKHLENPNTLADFQIVDGDCIIVMMQKKHTTAPAQEIAPPKPTVPAPQPAPVVTPPPAPQPPINLPHPAPGAPAHPPQPHVQLDPNNEIVYGSQHKNEFVKELMEMGFGAAESEKALQAAFFNKERAIDYLLNGIPQNLVAPPAPAQGGAPHAPGAPGAPAPGAPAQGAQGGPQAIALTPEQAAEIQQLVASPEFENIRQQIMQNPQVLQQLIAYLQQNKPTLYALFQQNPNLLIALLAGQVNFGDGGDDGPDEEEELGAVEAQLTPDDNAAIENLKSLGFTEAQCKEAYLLCDKKLDVAINYLLDMQGNAPAQAKQPKPPQNPPKPPNA